MPWFSRGFTDIGRKLEVVKGKFFLTAGYTFLRQCKVIDGRSQLYVRLTMPHSMIVAYRSQFQRSGTSCRQDTIKELAVALKSGWKQCQLWLRYYFTLRLFIPKSLPSEFLSSWLKGSLTLPVFARHSCVYKTLIFCNSVSKAAVLLANARNVVC